MPDEVLIALGANLPHPLYGSPRFTLEAALAALPGQGVAILARSNWYESAPVPASDQPWFLNGVALCQPSEGPADTLRALHRVEAAFGRARAELNAPRMLDLDLLAWGSLVNRGPEPPLLPHPRLHERAFVLLPLAEILPHWRHPVSGLGVGALVAALPPGQEIRRMRP